MALVSERSIFLFSVLLALCLLVQQGYCRPQQEDEGDDSEYNNDGEDDDYDDTEDDEEDSGASGPPPEFVSKPINLNLRPGDTATLPCVTTGLGKHVLIWLNGSATLTIGQQSFTPRAKIMADNSLVIYGVTSEDSGSYTCQITSLPTLNLTHTLLVPAPAKIIYHSDAQRVSAGQNVTLRCEASGYPNPNITWLKDGKPFSKAIFEENGRVMTILGVAKQHSGMYNCTADNGIGKAASVDIHVVVNVPPQVRINPTSLRTGEGEEVELTCVVLGHPKPSIKWMKDGVEIPKKSEIEMSTKGNTHYLKIKKLQKSDFGIYTCSAHNDLGSDKKEMTLSGLPGVPVLKDSGHVDGKVKLEWNVESYAPVIQHVLQYRRKGADKWTNVKPEVEDANGNTYNVKIELSSLLDGDYEAVLRSQNEFGWSQSETIVFEGIAAHDQTPSDETSEKHDASEQPAAETSIGEPENNGITCGHSKTTILTAFLTVFVVKFIVL